MAIKRICMEWIAKSDANLIMDGTQLLTDTAVFSSTFIKDNQIAGRAHDCYFVNRQIEFQPYYKVYLPMIFKNM
jgi:hypothetical protein